MICEVGAHYQPPFFGYVHLPQPEYYFSSFFFLQLSTFEAINALYSKFE